MVNGKRRGFHINGVFEESKELYDGFENVHKATTKNAAETALNELETKLGKQYPVVIGSWRNKWERLITYFKYPEDERKAIYITNAVEAVCCQFRN